MTNPPRSLPSDSSTSVSVRPSGPVNGSIRPPGSKSLTNRALLCAAMASGPSVLAGALRSEDTEVMIDALRKLGVDVQVRDDGRTLHVGGRENVSIADPTSAAVELYIANSGTTIRFLTAALSALGGVYRLSGVDRMHQRPIGDLTDSLSRVVAGQVRTESEGGCPPVFVETRGWSDGDVEVGGEISSQYLSGLMMAAPLARRERRIRVRGQLVSRPYVEMTAAVIRDFGGTAETGGGATEPRHGEAVRIGPETYRGTNYAIEPDASAASYFWAAAAITGGSITVDGLSRSAVQGDVAFCDVLAKMGCDVTHHDHAITVAGGDLVGVDVDMNAISDTVQTLAVVALFASGKTRVRGVAHNRFKETDRIGDLARELRKLGARVTEHDDGMTIEPPKSLAASRPPAAVSDGLNPTETDRIEIETYHDHRMAMSLALAGLRIPGVYIRDPGCTAKTYPDFFADLESLVGQPHAWR